MFYRWIVIESSLKDKSILKKYQILSETKFGEGPMFKVRVPEEEVDNLADFLKENIIKPYYTHLYCEDPKIDRLVVVFTGKRMNTKKSNYHDAFDYGVTHGVSKEEMVIQPTDASQEQW